MDIVDFYAEQWKQIEDERFARYEKCLFGARAS